MAQRIVLLIFALLCAPLFAGQSDPDDTGKIQPWIVTQEKGLVSGTFNPWKRGIKLPPKARIMVIPVRDDETTKDGMIDEWQAQFIRRRLNAAQQQKFDLIVLEIDAHDGEIHACESVLAEMQKCKIPIIALVKTKAFGVGSLLAQGCKMIVMDPNAEIGSLKIAKRPEDMTVEQQTKFDAALKRIVKDVSEINGYSPALAKGMVDPGTEVIETTDSNQRFMTGEEFQAASKRGVGQVNTIIKRKDQPVWLSAQKSVELGLAAGMAANTDELALGMASPDAQFSRMEISTAETIARFLSNPLWRVIMVVIGLIALFIEMKSPGHGLGYAVFAFCMGVFFWLQIFAHNAGLLELGLFGVGALLVAVELFVLPTFGTLGFLGIAMVLISIVLAFLPEGSVPGLLGYSGKPNEYLMKQIIEGMQWATLTLLSIIGFFSLVWWKGISLPGLNRIALNTVNSGTFNNDGASSETQRADGTGPASAGTTLGALAGHVGTAETMLRPAGKIRLEGKTYDAISEGGFIAPGAAVYVLRAQGSALVVRMSV